MDRLFYASNPMQSTQFLFRKPVVQSFLNLMAYNDHPALDGVGADVAFELYAQLKAGVREAYNDLRKIVDLFTPTDVVDFLVLKRASADDPVAKEALGLVETGAAT
eukprot:4760197-Pleurochrysis_carterae.AAC.1